jgi:sortase A
MHIVQRSVLTLIAVLAVGLGGADARAQLSQGALYASNIPPQSESFYVFTRDLFAGSRGADVQILQQFLNAHGAQVSGIGPGSPGNETTYFGQATRAALARWQAANGIAPAVGYFGPKSRAATMAIMRGTASVPPQSIPSGAASSSLPVRLIIPRIGTDAVIEYVGLTPERAMDVPKGPGSTAWFSPGPRPGEAGSAVIAGHFGWKDGIPAVFDNLHTLQKGDKIYVVDGAGNIVTFVVRELRAFGENENASDVFVSTDGGAHLNLVTCQGIWNKDRRSYSNRLVVFADKVIE